MTAALQVRARRHRAVLGPGALAGGAVLAQVAYPLLDGPGRATGPLTAVTVVAVLLFTAATLSHAAATLGPRPAVVLLVVAGGIGLGAEAVGVATGGVFGAYSYAGTLGPQPLGVPALVPLAWTMMAYPTLLAGRALGRPRPWATVPLAAWALASWDLFLDPQMVAAGHWTWADPDPGLPGIEGVPLTNFAGWLVVSLVLQATLHRALPRHRPGTPMAVPAALLSWTWLGSVLANAVFFGRPAVAAWGGIAMGVVVGPALLAWRRRRA